MEKRTRDRVRKQNLRKAVLTTVAVAGVMAMALAAPNTLQLLKYAPGMKSRYRLRAQRTTERLISQGYLRKKGQGPRSTVEITERGEALLARLSIGTEKYKPPETWDGKWRIVIFDIPEVRAQLRMHLRTMLQAIGFHMLQASVWVYPHDCEDLIVLLKKDFSLGKEVLYIIADEIEGDWKLRNQFGLKS